MSVSTTCDDQHDPIITGREPLIRKIEPIIIMIASSHFEVRRNKLAPMAYAYFISTDPAHVGWGYGGARETKEMLAHGLSRGSEQAFLEDEDAVVQVVVQRDGFTRYLSEFIPRWRKQMTTVAFERHNFRTWERLHTLWELGNIKVREPNDAEVQTLYELQKRAKEIAGGDAYKLFAEDPLSYVSAGVYRTDEDGSR